MHKAGQGRPWRGRSRAPVQPAPWPRRCGTPSRKPQMGRDPSLSEQVRVGAGCPRVGEGGTGWQARRHTLALRSPPCQARGGPLRQRWTPEPAGRAEGRLTRSGAPWRASPAAGAGEGRGESGGWRARCRTHCVPAALARLPLLRAPSHVAGGERWRTCALERSKRLTNEGRVDAHEGGERSRGCPQRACWAHGRRRRATPSYSFISRSSRLPLRGTRRPCV